MNKNVKKPFGSGSYGMYYTGCFFPKDQRHSKTKVIDEVVVTALGIKRMNKSLGYAAENKDSKYLKTPKTTTGQMLWKEK